MTSNAAPKLTQPDLLNAETGGEESALQWPEPDVPIDEAILKMFKIRVLRLLSDTMTTPSQMLSAVRRLEVMKEFPLRVEKQARTLAMAEARIDLRRRSLALREALLQERLANAEEKKARVLAKKTQSESTQPVSNAKPKSVMISNEIDPKAEPTAKPATKEPQVSPKTSQTTEELLAMEWDLRSTFNFGDLRPFEFCIGAQIVRFPDRSAHPEAAKMNYPVNFKPKADFVPRSDEYLILPHALPPAFAQAKAKQDRPSTTWQRVAPILKEGRPDWSRFVKPLTTGKWPHNTILPQDWQDGDPIPGTPESI